MSEVVGKIKTIKGAETFGASNFRKRELVVVTDEQYPQTLLIEFVQDKCDLLDNYVVGQDVKVSINLRGRSWTNPEGEEKVFNSLQGWRIESYQSTNAAASNAASNLTGEEPDDLPF